MKVCILTTDFPYRREEGTITQGGGGACVAQLVKGLIEEGIEVVVITRAERGKYKEIFNIPIHRTTFLNFGFRESKITHSIFAFIKGIEVFRKEKFDIIHSHNPPAALSGVCLSKLYNKPHLITLHGPWAGVRLNPIVRGIGRLIEGSVVHLADLITCVSQSLKDEVLSTYRVNREKVVYIPNVIDINLFKPLSKNEARKKIGIKTDDKIILFTGRFVREKGLPYLLEAARDILNKYNNVSFLLLGGGFDEEIVRSWVEKNPNIRKKILLLPYMEYEKLRYVYFSSDIFVLPSLAEGLSMSILEAMACGLPVIATRVGGNPELVGEEAGILIKPKDAREIASSIKRLLDDEALAEKMGKEGRKKVKTVYGDVKKRIKAFIEIYKNLAK